MSHKAKKCKNCGSKFTPVSSLQTTCSIKCTKELENAKKVAKIAKEKEKKVKAKEKKHNSISYLTDKADDLWSEAVKIAHCYKCAYCGK